MRRAAPLLTGLALLAACAELPKPFAHDEGEVNPLLDPTPMMAVRVAPRSTEVMRSAVRCVSPAQVRAMASTAAFDAE